MHFSMYMHSSMQEVMLKTIYNANCRTGLSFIKPGSQLVIALGLFIIDSKNL